MQLACSTRPRTEWYPDYSRYPGHLRPSVCGESPQTGRGSCALPLKSSRRSSLRRLPGFCDFGYEQFLTDLQFAQIVDVIELEQTVVRHLQFAGDRGWIITLRYHINLS